MNFLIIWHWQRTLSVPQLPRLVQPCDFFGGFEGTTPRLATEVSDLHFLEALPVKVFFKKESSGVELRVRASGLARGFDNAVDIEAVWEVCAMSARPDVLPEQVMVRLVDPANPAKVWATSHVCSMKMDK